MKKTTKITLIVIWLLCLTFCFIKIKNKTNSNNNNNNVRVVVENLTIEDMVNPELIIDEKVIENELADYESQKQEEKTVETYTTMYSKVGLNIRKEPNLNSEIVDVVNINTELQIVDNSDNGEWTKIKRDENYYYVASKYWSNEKVKIKQLEKTVVKDNNRVSRSNSNNRNNSGSTGVLTKSKGVNYYNGHRETWYSQKALPGGGLKIPGRHVDNRGLVCDGDGYICVASNDYPKGTIVKTSLGTGKVYDCGCASGTIDIYTNW